MTDARKIQRLKVKRRHVSSARRTVIACQVWRGVTDAPSVDGPPSNNLSRLHRGDRRHRTVRGWAFPASRPIPPPATARAPSNSRRGARRWSRRRREPDSAHRSAPRAPRRCAGRARPCSPVVAPGRPRPSCSPPAGCARPAAPPTRSGSRLPARPGRRAGRRSRGARR